MINITVYTYICSTTIGKRCSF